jgi:hypothetical protein
MALPPFAKEVWTEADVLAIAASDEEGLYLEFKRPAALNDKPEIGRDVSSFANADGGTIIYGIAENPKAPHDIEPVDPTLRTRESLEQIIDSNIIPKVRGVRVSTVHSSGSTGRFYVVDIPRAAVGAHQSTTDCVYYRRQNTSKYRMSHYEVMELSRRSESPMLFVTLRLPPTNKRRMAPNLEQNNYSGYFHFDWVIENEADAVCEYAAIDLFIDDRLLRKEFVGWWVKDSIPIRTVIDGSRYKAQLAHVQCGWKTPERMPLFRGVPALMGDGALSFPSNYLGVPYFVIWRCRAPKMEEQNGAFSITHDGTDFRVESVEYDSIDFDGQEMI